MKYEWTCTEDSILHGYKKKFFSTGQVEKLVNYQLGKKQGSILEYYQGGSLKAKGQFKNDLRDSSFVWYFEDGTTKSINNYSEGTLFGNQFNYRENGRIEEYFFCSVGGGLVYSRKYDSQGELFSESGIPIWCVANKFKLKSGEKVELLCFLAIPPDNDFSLTIFKIMPDGQVVEKVSPRVDDFSLSYSAVKFVYSEIAKTAGDFSFRIDLELRDKKSATSKYYNTQLTFNVSP